MRKVLAIPADGGDRANWGDFVALSDDSAGDLVLDLTNLESPDVLLLVRLRCLIDSHCAAGHRVEVIGPSDPSTRKHLEHMRLMANMPQGCECDLDASADDGASDVLIPIRHLRSSAHAVELDQELERIYLAHFRGKIAPLAGVFTRAVGEISDNATTHGASQDGCTYVAAQRDRRARCVFAIGDLGVGIPAHIRRARPDFQDDEVAIREATKEGISGTGDATRGFGYQEVIDALKETAVGYGELRVWSGHGRFRVATSGGIQLRRRAWMVDNPTRGTWVRVELAG